MNQLILPYQKNIKKKFDSFFCDNEKNDQIVENIKNIFDSQNNQIYIWGDKSFGKSHLLYAACNYFGEKNKKCVYLPLSENKKFEPDILDGFDNYDLVCIDNIDLIFQKEDWEYSFFVLINKILDKSKKIIFTSSSSLALNNINLKDFHSRLSSSLIFMINSPNDTTKENILKRVILEKEYNINIEICEYLLKRKDRDIDYLLKIIDKIGNYSLSTNKKIGKNNLSLVIN
jgi:DnaA-homolog protein